MRRWTPRLLLALLAVFLVWQGWFFARVAWYVRHDPATTSFIREREPLLRREGVRLRRHWVPYRAIAPELKRAVVAAEDSRFLDHDGFDWDGIQDAIVRDLRAGRVVAGGSTISQQLAKNLFLSPRRTLWRKGEEALITVMIEHLMSKRRILEIYLNVIEWGNGIYGADAAARHYFGTDAALLTPAQAARLAAMIPDPRYFQRHPDSPYLQRRAAIIQARMRLVAVP